MSVTIEDVMAVAVSYGYGPRKWTDELRASIEALVAQARDEALEHCIDVCNVHASDNGTAQKIANDINGWRIAGRKAQDGGART